MAILAIFGHLWLFLGFGGYFGYFLIFLANLSFGGDFGYSLSRNMLEHPVPAYLFIYCGLFTSFAIEQCHSSKERETKEDDY